MTEQNDADSSGLIPGVPPPAFKPRPLDATARAIAAHDKATFEIVTKYLPGAVAEIITTLRLTCFGCYQRKCRWNAANPGLIDAAYLAACAARDIDPADPAAHQQVPVSEAFDHMPEHLRHDAADPWNPVRMPLMYRGVTTVGGTLLCDHCATEVCEQQLAQAAAQAAFAANAAAQQASEATSPDQTGSED